MKADNEKRIKKAVSAKVRGLKAEREKRKRQKLAKKKLKISDIKHGEGAQVRHLLNRIKAREVELTFCCVVVILAIILISLYFVFSSVQNPMNYSVVSVGSLKVSFDDRDDNLGDIVDLTPVEPLTDADGVQSRVYQLRIENTSRDVESFQIQLMRDVAMINQDNCGDEQVPNDYIRYQIDDGVVETVDGTKRSPIIYTDALEGKEKQLIQIRIWVSDTLPSEYLNYHYHGKLVIKSSETVK